MNTPLAQVFRYNAWANDRIIAACRPLTGAQLDEKVQGTEERTIRDTLLHLIDGQRSFLARLEGQAQPTDGPRQWDGFDALTASSLETSEALIAAAEALIDDSDVVVPFAGQRPIFPKSFFLTHAIAHGVMHRTEICAMLRTLGVEPPNLDGWEYAAFAGLGVKQG